MDRPRLTVVVPVYNEERTLPLLMERLQRACGGIAQIIYVDDGSADRSPQILRACAQPQDLVLTKGNGGKGSAVRMGFQHARGRYTIVQDADLEYSPEEIPSLLAFAEERNLPAVFGSRRLKKQKQFRHVLFYLGGTFLTFYCNLLYRTRLTDQPTCYKLALTDLLQILPLTEDDFRFDPELTALLARCEVPIAEYPVSYRPRSLAEGKKINWKDWFRWMWTFTKLRLTPLRSVSYEPAPGTLSDA